MNPRRTFKRRVWIVVVGFAAIFAVIFIGNNSIVNKGYTPQYSFSKAATSVPVLLRATWHADPGQAIGIYGWNFGTDTSTVTVAIQPLSIGALNPVSAQYSLQVEDVQNDLVEGFLPANIPGDVYAIWVNNGSGWSNVEYINQTEVFWADQGTIYPGQHINIVGRNFRNPASGAFNTFQAQFVNTTNGDTFSAPVDDVSDYAAGVVAPIDLQPGDTYTIRATNGAGGVSGWGTMEDQTSTKVVADSANIEKIKELFGVDAAWDGTIPTDASHTFSVANYGAVGDGKTLDTAALQATFNLASVSGGGIVNIPAGTYESGSLDVPNNIIVAGAGPSSTKLEYVDNWNGTGEDGFIFSGSRYGTSTVGFANISVMSTGMGGSATSVVGLIHGPGYTSFYSNVNLSVQNIFGQGAGGGSGDTIIQNSTIQVPGTAFVAGGPASHVHIVNNVFKNTIRPLLFVSPVPDQSIVYDWIVGNTLIGSGCFVNDSQPGCAGSASGFDGIEHRDAEIAQGEAYIANNITTGSFGAATNDGEGLNFQPEGRLAYSRATAATADTLTDNTQSFSVGSTTGAFITIIGGKGIGQLRTIIKNTATTFTINTPWTIIPDTTSIYTIDTGRSYHNIIVDNNFGAEQNAAAVEFYTKSFDNIIANNTISNSAGIMTAANEVVPDRADYAYFDYITGNTVKGGNNPLGGSNSNYQGVSDSMIGANAPFYVNDVDQGTVMFGDEIRSNVMVGTGASLTQLCATSRTPNCAIHPFYDGIMISETGVKNPFPFSQGTIVEKNTISNALDGVNLGNNAYDTFLTGNNFSDDGEAVNDTGSVRTTCVPYSAGNCPPEVALPVVSLNPPTDLIVSGVTTSSADISWKASTSTGVVGYELLRSGVKIVLTPDTSFLNIGLSPDTAYTYNVVAYDSLGNTSAETPGFNITTGSPTDNIPPTAVITSPLSDTQVSGIINVTSSVNDNVGVAKVELYANGSLMETDSVRPYDFSLNTTALPNGSDTIYVKGYDTNNNVGVSGNVDIIVMNAGSGGASNFAINNIAVSNVTQTSADLIVTTNKAAGVEMRYGPTPAYGVATPVSPPLTTIYENVPNLVPATTYYFDIIATPLGSTSSAESTGTFTTAGTPITVGVGNGGGGGGGGGGTPPPVQTPTPSSTTPIGGGSSSTLPVASSSSTTVYFSRPLSYGDTGTDVNLLQKVLRSLGFFPANIIPTSFFGVKTQAAMSLFQAAHGLSQTESLDVDSLPVMNAAAQAVLATTQTTSTGSFTRRLLPGSSGADVMLLQQLLVKDGDYPQGIISGYFGSLTERAVEVFQSKHGIVSYGSPYTNGYGSVGPKTEAALEEII